MTMEKQVGSGIPQLYARVREVERETLCTIESAIYAVAEEYELRSEAIKALKDYCWDRIGEEMANQPAAYFFTNHPDPDEPAPPDRSAEGKQP